MLWTTIKSFISLSLLFVTMSFLTIGCGGSPELKEVKSPDPTTIQDINNIKNQGTENSNPGGGILSDPKALCALADFDESGLIDEKDLLRVIVGPCSIDPIVDLSGIANGGCLGDLDKNGIVTDDEYQLIESALGTICPYP